MKILFIDMYAVLGGVPIQLINRFKGLKDTFECHFSFLYDYGGISLFNGYEYVYVLNNKKDLEQLINKYNYDVISIIDANIVYEWLNDISYNGFIINEVHTTYEKNLEKLLILKTNPKINVIVAPSQYMKDIIENKYEFRNLIPVEVIPNCLDYKIFNIKEVKFKNTIEINNRNKVYKILWIGRLDEHKRYNDFLKICKILEDKYKEYNFKYIVVGGINSSENTIDNLVDRLIDYNILSKFTWYSSIEYSDIYKIYNEVKSSGGVYVSTSLNESFGMTVLESIASNLPVVIPNVGALSELISKSNQKDCLYESKNLENACELIINQLNKNPIYNLEKYSTKKYLENMKYIISKYKNCN